MCPQTRSDIIRQQYRHRSQATTHALGVNDQTEDQQLEFMLKHLFVKCICTVICLKFILCVNYNSVYRPSTITVSQTWSNKNYDTAA